MSEPSQAVRSGPSEESAKVETARGLTSFSATSPARRRRRRSNALTCILPVGDREFEAQRRETRQPAPADHYKRTFCTGLKSLPRRRSAVL